MLIIPPSSTSPLLVETGIYEGLIKVFGTALRDMGLISGDANFMRTLWDGQSFQPMETLLAKALRAGDWTVDHVTKFLWIVSDSSLAGWGDKGLVALEEAFKTDPLLAGFAAIGLSPKFFYVGGLGTDPQDMGAGLTKWLLSQVPDNSAPEALADMPAEIGVIEGGSVGLPLGKLFADADGDTLTFRVEGADSRLSVTLSEDGQLQIDTGRASAGTHHLTLIASDGFNETFHELAVVVEDAGAGAHILTRDFKRLLAQAETLDDALATTGASRGIDILDQSAVGDGPHLVAARNLTIRGAEGVAAEFTLASGVQAITLVGGADFSVTGNAMNNVVRGAEGRDVLRGAAGIDQLFGNGGDDEIHGGSELDKLYGGAGDDRIFGDDGSDQLFGGDGNDVLRGGAGRDQATGGAGADEFDFVHGDGVFIIRDAVRGEDHLRLAGFDQITDLASFQAQARIQDIAGGVRVTIGAEQIIVYGLHGSDLAADFLIFA